MRVKLHMPTQETQTSNTAGESQWPPQWFISHMITNHWNKKMPRRKGGAGGCLNESANLTGYPVNRRKSIQSIDGQQKQREYQNYDMLPNQIFHLTVPHRIYQQALQKIPAPQFLWCHHMLCFPKRPNLIMLDRC